MPNKPSHWITIETVLTVAELPEFIHTANKLLTKSERQDIIRYLAEHPKSGDLLECAGASVNFGGRAAAKENRGRSRHLLFS